MILYFTEVRRGARAISNGAVYANDPREVVDRKLAHSPLAEGDKLVVTDYNGFEVARVDATGTTFSRVA